MFRIIPVLKDDIEKTKKYLNSDTKGMILACYENGGITGAASFDIEGGAGYLESVKTDSTEMINIMAKSVLNFLEMHSILDVYAMEGVNDELYAALGFKPAQEKQNGYGLYLNLEGYFTHEH